MVAETKRTMQDTQPKQSGGRNEKPPFTGTKSPLQSKTVIGVVAFLLATAAQRSGAEIGDAEITDLITLGVQLIGGIVAIYGRFKARTSLR